MACSISQNESNLFRIWISKTRRVVESRNAVLIEIPRHFLPRSGWILLLQGLEPPTLNFRDSSLDDGDSSRNGMIQDAKDYTSALDSKRTTHYLFLHPGVLRQGVPRRRNHRLQLHPYLRLCQKRRLHPCLHRWHRKQPPQAPTATPRSLVIPAPLLAPFLAVKFVRLHLQTIGRIGTTAQLWQGLFQKDTVQQVHKLGSPKLGYHANLDIAHRLDDTFSTGNANATTITQGSFSAGEQNKKIPNTFKKAMGLPQAARWRAASDKEVARLEKHVVYELIPITSAPTGLNVIGMRWINKIKEDGTYKRRLVIQGQPQVPGSDYGGTFAPVCRVQGISMMQAIAAEPDYEVFMLDVQMAFLKADVLEDIFAKMAPGYEIADNSGAPLVMKLNNSLYGLRYSPRNWFGTMDHHLAKLGFFSLKSDPCLYVFEENTGFVILTLYVDDILLLGANKHLLNKLKKQLMVRFQTTDVGDVLRMFGMNVNRDRNKRTITIDQKDYTHGGHRRALWYEEL